jgi:two-component system response regulator AtoC
MSSKSKDQKIAWIVDDDPTYRNFIEAHLKTLRYTVTQFPRGEDCLPHVHTLPDLIILDHNLGDGINGLETLRSIKAMNPEIPVVYLSAQDDLSSAVEALKHGVYDYIEKNESAIVRLKNVIHKIEGIHELLRKRYQSQIRILVLTALACFAVILSLMFYVMGK